MRYCCASIDFRLRATGGSGAADGDGHTARSAGRAGPGCIYYHDAAEYQLRRQLDVPWQPDLSEQLDVPQWHYLRKHDSEQYDDQRHNGCRRQLYASSRLALPASVQLLDRIGF